LCLLFSRKKSILECVEKTHGGGKGNEVEWIFMVLWKNSRFKSVKIVFFLPHAAAALALKIVTRDVKNIFSSLVRTGNIFQK
jgi:hypothetical protein